jgi:Immunoglobulin I-set domain
VILTNPTNQSVYAGSAVSFSASAVGDPIPSVRWQVKTNGGSSFTDISGATNVAFTFTTAAANNGNQYRAFFVNTVNNNTTTAATLTVNSPSAPALSSVTYTNNQFQLSVTGTSGVNYIVQMATNLASPVWTPVQTNIAPFTFTEPSADGFSQRFYRVLSP